jgi:exopolysaccharide biosynthesis polyprenyl glycosylphosphotransferase
VLIALATSVIVFWDRQFAFPRSVIILSTVLMTTMLFGCRLAVRQARLAVFGRSRALFICNDAENGHEIVRQINSTKQDWMRVEAVLEAKELVRFYEIQSKFDTVIVADNVDRKAEIIDYCASHKQEAMVVPDFFELSMVGARPLQIDDILLFNIKPPHLSPGQRMLKRILDLFGSTVLIGATFPLFLLIPIVIRLSSRGPALFKQERVGLNGKEYTVYKFRTMVDDAEQRTGPVLAADDDPRITRLGKLLRSTRLDELPQLFNVLRGEMSLVGPRPERAHFVREFCLTVPSYQYRQLVKPGITGMAQVYGRYSTTPARKLSFDLMYIYDYSLILDLKILLKTILVVIKREQASGIPTTAETTREADQPARAVVFTK